jgi:hypothetical protein
MLNHRQDKDSDDEEESSSDEEEEEEGNRKKGKSNNRSQKIPILVPVTFLSKEAPRLLCCLVLAAKFILS